jgi:hypothetical protein
LAWLQGESFYLIPVTVRGISWYAVAMQVSNFIQDLIEVEVEGKQLKAHLNVEDDVVAS